MKQFISSVYDGVMEIFDLLFYAVIVGIGVALGFLGVAVLFEGLL